MITDQEALNKAAAVLGTISIRPQVVEIIAEVNERDNVETGDIGAVFGHGLAALIEGLAPEYRFEFLRTALAELSPKGLAALVYAIPTEENLHGAPHQGPVDKYLVLEIYHQFGSAALFQWRKIIDYATQFDREI